MRATLIAISLLAAVMVGSAIVIVLRQAAPVRPADGWRSDDDALSARLLRLGQAGDLSAAQAVLDELLKRPDDGYRHDQARLAMARARLAAKDRQGALAQLAALPWADKSPTVAAEIVSLEAAIRWQGLLDETDVLRSGMVAPRDCPDSNAGAGAGAWGGRREAFSAFAALMAGGVRMVEAEGGAVRMGVHPALIDLARYAHGAIGADELGRRIGARQRLPPDVLLAETRLHLEEHEIEPAWTAATALWHAHPSSTQAANAAGLFAAWQMRRARAAKSLRLWEYPSVETGLADLAARYPAASAAAASAIDAERDLNQLGMRQELRDRVLTETIRVEMSDAEAGLPDGEQRPAFALALTYDGLHVDVPPAVPTGTPVTIGISSELRTAHTVRLHRIADQAQWVALAADPRCAALPPPVAERVVAYPSGDSPPGSVLRQDAIFPAQAEGRYAVTVTARGCPVVVLRSLRVAGADMQVVAGDDGILVWAVSRSDGCARAGEPVTATVTLERSTETAAGDAWVDASAAWRSGFIAGFTGHSEAATISSDQQAAYDRGVAAGSAAAMQDPAFTGTVRGTTGVDGICRLAVPDRCLGRSWTATVVIDRPDADERRTVRHGEATHWSANVVVWADKPLVRPGETLRFAAIVRETDGEQWRRPRDGVQVVALAGDEEIWHGRMAADGALLHGEFSLPPACLEGPISIVVDQGPRHAIAHCASVRLPPLSWELVDARSFQQAGTDHTTRLRLRDAGGAPLNAVDVTCTVTASDGGPCEQPARVSTDLTGEAVLTIPGSTGRTCTWSARLDFTWAGRSWFVVDTWRTDIFPVPVEAIIDEPTVEVDGVLRPRLRLPTGASVELCLVRGSGVTAVEIGRPITVTGRDGQWIDAALPVVEARSPADALRVRMATLGGASAERMLPVTILPRPRLGEGTSVDCIASRTRVRPGDAVAVTVGIDQPRRDVLLVTGATRILDARSIHLDAVAASTVLSMSGAWGPTCHLQATAWLPGRGFVTSQRRTIAIEPIDRMLHLRLDLDGEPIPGSKISGRLHVRDWRDRPVTDVRIALGVVDERSYLIADDTTPDLWRHFHSGSRPWSLVAGTTDALGSLDAVFWRSIAWRWQDGVGAVGQFGSRSGGGRKRAIAHGGGSAGPTSSSALLEPAIGEGDPTVVWLPDIACDEHGQAAIAIDLPDRPGRWRITARCADTSRDLLVGELRTTVAARARVQAQIEVPTVARPSDRLPAVIHLVVAEDAAGPALLRCTGVPDRPVTLVGGGRQRITVELPPAIGEGPPILVDGALARMRPLVAQIIVDGAVLATTLSTIAVRLPGLPRRHQLALVADAEGRLELPFEIGAGSAVHIAGRAWPDGAARRAAAIAGQLDGGGPRAALAWICQEPGGRRRARLAELWGRLDQSAASIVVRHEAIRRNVAAGLAEAGEGLLGDWLLARGRALGLALPAPRLRGEPGRNASERACAAATAVAEGWSESGRLWRDVRDELLAGGCPARAIAIGLDAARLAGDTQAHARLAALLAHQPWDDDLVWSLAVCLLPERASAPGDPLEVSGGIVPGILAATPGASWSGILVAPLALRTRPGAWVELDLDLHADPPLWTGPAPRIGLWQEGRDGYEPVSGDCVMPGRRLLLIIDGRGIPGLPDDTTVDISLPSLLRWTTRRPSVRLIERRRRDHPLPAHPALDQRLADWVVDPSKRDSALAMLRSTIEELTDPVDACDGLTIDAIGIDSPGDVDVQCVQGSGGLLRVDLRADRRIVALAVAAEGEGIATWPGGCVMGAADGYGARRIGLLAARTLVVGGADLRSPVTADTPPVHQSRVRTLSAAWGVDEVRWLLDQKPATDAEWQMALDHLDPTATHDLDMLLTHPCLGHRGHWCMAAVRRWLDAEPDYDDPTWSGPGVPATLSDLVAQAAEARSRRIKAWTALPAPQAAPTGTQATVRRWYDRAVALGQIRSSDFATWAWSQPLEASDLAILGRPATIDGWAGFLQDELGLTVRIAPGVATVRGASEPRAALSLFEPAPAPITVPVSGTGLGSVGLVAMGLVVVATAPGSWELRCLPPVASRAIPLSVAWTDVPAITAVAELDAMLRRRKHPGLRLAEGIDVAALPTLTMQVTDAEATVLIDAVAKILGLDVRRRSGGWQLTAP